MSSSGAYPKYRAPQGDGEILCVPDAEALPGLVAQNRSRPELANARWFGASLEKIAREARAEILDAAARYTGRYADVGRRRASAAPIIVTGHQPELFHPGVWLKNFEAARLAETCGGTAVNLIIDSDLCRSPTIRVPVGSSDSLRAESVPFDRADHELPFEEREIADPSLWNTFGARVTEAIAPLVSEPLIATWWPMVLEASRGGDNLGRSLSRARHEQERAWGDRSLELPQSLVCQTAAFRMFAMELFTRPADFRSAHNEALANYRRAHRLKNHAQPLPNLAEKDGWVETPFWLWGGRDPHRRGAYVRAASGGQLEVSDLDAINFTLPGDPPNAVEGLERLEARGIKLRTRALATTLFSRLLVADVFIHGIGGAKYDQVTEEICTRFFRMELPAHATISGTLRLAIPAPNGPLRSVAELRRELRQHRFHPETLRYHMTVADSEAELVNGLISTKREWINTTKTSENAARRHEAIEKVNRRLQEFLTQRRMRIEEEIAAAKLVATSEQLRTSREYAYCLFPAAQLRNFFRV